MGEGRNATAERWMREYAASPSSPLLHYYAILNYLPCVAEFEIP